MFYRKHYDWSFLRGMGFEQRAKEIQSRKVTIVVDTTCPVCGDSAIYHPGHMYYTQKYYLLCNGQMGFFKN